MTKKKQEPLENKIDWELVEQIRQIQKECQENKKKQTKKK